MIRLVFSFILVTYGLSAHARLSCNFDKSKFDLSKCQGKKIHLTFDDGPHETYTPIVLESLKRSGNIPATFFVTTSVLKSGNKAHKEALIRSIQDSSVHVLATHGHIHQAHDTRIIKGREAHSFGEDESLKDIQMSIKELDRITGGEYSKKKNKLIRFPYARGIAPSREELNEIRKREHMAEFETMDDYIRQYSYAMRNAASENLSHLRWNHDSGDSSGTYNSNNQEKYISNFIAGTCNNSKRNLVSLLHDIQKINALKSNLDGSKTVLDEIIYKLKCLGVDFVSLNEILKQKLRYSVYTPASSIISEHVSGKVDEYDKTIVQENVQPKIVCSREVDSNTGLCKSSVTGDYYQNCEGSNSICYNGKWYAKNLLKDPINMEQVSVAHACGYGPKRFCISDTNGNKYNDCEGESSVCFSGTWYSRNALRNAESGIEFAIKFQCGIE